MMMGSRPVSRWTVPDMLGSPGLRVGAGPLDEAGAMSRDTILPAMDRIPDAKPSFFGQGGTGRGMAGALGDFLLQRAGGSAIYAPAMQQQRAMAAQRQQRMDDRRIGLEDYSRKRDDEFSDWERQQRFKINNPAPAEPTSLERTANYYRSIGRDDLARSYIENVASGPPMSVDEAQPNGDVIRRFVPRASIMGGQPSAPAAPIVPAAPGGTNSYRSSAYDALEGPLEQEYGLPAGLMSRIRTKGERSNADQVSPAGARSVYQVIPSTRDAFKRKYGVDAYAGPEQAARVAALHLRDSMQRGEDPVRGYIGGPDRSRWGPQTQAYAGRVNGGVNMSNAGGPPPGTIMGGFRFKGGNPKNRANWARAS